MKNKLYAIMSIFALCFTLVFTAGAVGTDSLVPGFSGVERTLSLVEDYADVLTDEQEAELEAKLYELGNANRLEIGVITVDSYEGSYPQDFADDFYDYNGYGYGENDDGLIIVFNTGIGDGNRNITLSTHGRAINLITDAEMNEMFDAMISMLIRGEYVPAFDTFVDECESAIDTSVPLYYIPLAAAIGLLLAFIVVKIQASSLETVRRQADASDYVANIVLTGESDRFIYKNVRKTPKPKNNTSSTHRSSSGRTHGGGSRSF